MEYIKAAKEEGCVFCDVLEGNDDRKNLVLYRGETAFIIMNRYPYSNGHLMAVPARHVDNPMKLDDTEKLEIMNLLNICIEALRVFEPDGYNVGMNIGRAAGAGIDDHMHLHIVPRWEGDSNYMAVIADTRVIPEHLDDTYLKLKNALKSIINT